jgi:hypothetical protein
MERILSPCQRRNRPTIPDPQSSQNFHSIAQRSAARQIRDPGGAQRVGNALGESDQCAREQARLADRTGARLDFLLLALFQ